MSAQAHPVGLKGGACGPGLNNWSRVLASPECRLGMGHVIQSGHEESSGSAQWAGSSCSYPLRLTLAGYEASIVRNHLAPWKARK